MARRVNDVFARLRLLMSRHGPAPTTRLVLYAHSRFMNRDGTRCRVGVRRLAEDTGLDKSTVAQHRATAIQLGWLIAMKRRLGQGCGELLPAAPDAVAADQDAVASADSGQSSTPHLPASGTDTVTVRHQPQKCPERVDRSSPSITPPKNGPGMPGKYPPAQLGNPRISRETLERVLRDWMSRDPSVAKYLPLGDKEAVKALVPIPLRVFNHEELIEILVDESLAERSANPCHGHFVRKT